MIHKVNWQGGVIHAEVTDNVQVAKVLIKVLNTDGNLIEQGEALFIKDISWEYIPATQGKVIVEAWDLAGNITTKEIQ